MKTPLPEQRRRRTIAKKDRKQFLSALEAGWAVRHAAELTGVHFRRWYDLRKQDDEFAEEWREAIEQGTQALEDEARRRAVDGYEELTHDGEGKLIRRVRRYDGALLQTLLKGRRPEVYKDGAHARLQVSGRVEVTSDYAPPTLADVLALARRLGLDDSDVIDGEALEAEPLALPEGDAA